MARGGLYEHINRVANALLTADIYNEDHQQHINNLYPEKIDDYSETENMFRVTENPLNGAQVSRPTDLAGEIARLRFQIAAITGKTNWYDAPQHSIDTLRTILDTAQATNIFTGTGAPSGDIGVVGSLYIRKTVNQLSFYVRTASGWPSSANTVFQDTAGGEGGNSITVGSDAPTGSSNAGDVHLQISGNTFNFFSATGDMWGSDLTADLTWSGINITGGTVLGAPSGGDDGDLHFIHSGSNTFQVWRRTAGAWSTIINNNLNTFPSVQPAIVSLEDADRFLLSDNSDGNNLKHIEFSDLKSEISPYKDADSNFDLYPHNLDWEVILKDPSAQTYGRITPKTLLEESMVSLDLFGTIDSAFIVGYTEAGQRGKFQITRSVPAMRKLINQPLIFAGTPHEYYGLHIGLPLGTVWYDNGTQENGSYQPRMSLPIVYQNRFRQYGIYRTQAIAYNVNVSIQAGKPYSGYKHDPSIIYSWIGDLPTGITFEDHDTYGPILKGTPTTIKTLTQYYLRATDKVTGIYKEIPFNIEVNSTTYFNSRVEQAWVAGNFEYTQRMTGDGGNSIASGYVNSPQSGSNEMDYIFEEDTESRSYRLRNYNIVDPGA